jgi:hypothetical protein
MGERVYIISDSTGDLDRIPATTATEALDLWAMREGETGDITGRASINVSTLAVVGRGLIRAEREAGEWSALGPQRFTDQRSRLSREHGFQKFGVGAHRGVISRRGRGGKQETESCPHAHSKPAVARACAERAAKRANREIATDRKGAGETGASRSAGTVPVGDEREETTMSSSKTTGKQNRRVGPKEAEARAQRAAAAAAQDATTSANLAEAAAAADEKAKPAAPKPTRQLPNQDVDAASLEKALLAKIDGVKVVKKKAYNRLTSGSKSVGATYLGTRALTVRPLHGPRKDERIKITAESEIPAAAKAIADSIKAVAK